MIDGAPRLGEAGSFLTGPGGYLAPAPVRVSPPSGGCCSCCPDAPAGTACTSQCCACATSPVAAPPRGGGGGGEPTLADVLAGIGGGSAFQLPELPQTAAGLAPGERTTVPPFAILLILGGLGAGGYYLYRRSKKG